MPIAGSVVHQQLLDAYAQTQADLEAERAGISRARDDRDGLHGERGDALASLAEHYLPELTGEAMEKTWSEIRPAVSQLLLRKEDDRRQRRQQLEQLCESQESGDRQLLDTTRLLDDAIDEQQKVAEQVENRLGNDEQFVLLSNRAAVAEAALERAEANLSEIDQDAARKLPAYDNSALFRYLYDRGFGSPDYHKRGFTRRIDRTLANFIGFPKAKQGYEFLQETPLQMRKIIADDRVSLDVVMDELERRRDAVAEPLALPAKIETTRSLQNQRDGLLKTLDQLGAEIEATHNSLGELDDTRGPYYREAIGLFREILERSDARELNQRARETPEITDDQIVARLMGVERKIDQVTQEARRQSDALIEKQEFLRGLGRLVQRFRAAQFDLSRSQFVGSLDINEELARARDAGDVDHLWQRIRRAQRWGSSQLNENSEMAAPASTMSNVLANAMERAASGEMEGHARRAGDRRAHRDAAPRAGAN